MSAIPGDLKYLPSHEWVRLEDDGETVTIGITHHAQDLLGDVVFVGAEIVAGEEAGVVESVKAASDIFSPIAGKVIEINEGLEDSPELVNSDPYDDGWFFKMKVGHSEELEGLLSPDAYKELCDAEDH
jgi:glycine cleavage system H protein